MQKKPTTFDTKQQYNNIADQQHKLRITIKLTSRICCTGLYPMTDIFKMQF